MRMPPFGRGAHPKIRSSSFIHWVFDDTDPTVALDLVRAGGTDRSLSTYSTYQPPAIVRSPIGGLARNFVEGAGAGDNNILTAAGDATARGIMVGDLTWATWVRIPSWPSGSRTLYTYSTYPVDGDAADNYLFSVRLTSTGDLSLIWEYSTGTNVIETITIPGGLPRGEWLYLVVRKSGTTGEGGGATTTVTTFINGAQIDQRTVFNSEGGSNANHYVGGDRNNLAATTANNFLTGDMAGMYLWDAPLTPEEIEDDFRRGQARAFYNRVDFRLEIEDQAGAVVDLTDLEGVDWVDQVSVSDGADDPTMKATATMIREFGDMSLAYLRTDSKLNLSDKFDPESWSPIVDTGKTITLKAARVPLGIIADEGELDPVISGKIDAIDWGGDEMKIEWRDQGGELIDIFIEQEVNYSEPAPDQDPPGAGPFAVETEMQQILNDNDNDAGNNSSSAFPNDDPPLSITSRTGSYDPITLYVADSGRVPVAAGTDPTIVDWDVLIWRQRREPVLSALRNLAGQIGWECRYVWDGYNREWRLTFYEPQRDRTFPHIILDSNEINSISQMRIDSKRIRNVIRVPYSSSEDVLPTPLALSNFGVVGAQSVGWAGRDGKNDRMRASYLVELTASIARYGRRFMESAEASSSQIDTVFETQRMAVGIGKDLQEPEFDKSITMPCVWEIERQDVVRFRAARELYTVAQQAAVQTLTHTFGDAATTQLKVAGKPRVGYKRWLHLETRPGVAKPGVISPIDALTEQAQGSILASIKSLISQTDYLSGGKYLALRNNEFQFWTDGVQNPPDAWTVVAGTFGTDILREGTTVRAGGNAVRFVGVSGFLLSDPFPALDDVNTPYSFELDWQRVAGTAKPILEVRFYQGDRTTFISAHTLTPGGAATPDFPAAPAGTGQWITSRVDGVHPPSGTKFIRLRLRFDAAGTNIIDRVTAFRTSRASKATLDVGAAWLPVGGIAAGSGPYNSPLSLLTHATAYDRGNNIGVDEVTAPRQGHFFLAREPGTYDIEIVHWFGLVGGSTTTGDVRIELVKNGTYAATSARLGGTVIGQENKTVTFTTGVGQQTLKLSETVQLIEGDYLTVDYNYLSGIDALFAALGLPSQPSYWSVKLRSLD